MQAEVVVSDISSSVNNTINNRINDSTSSNSFDLYDIRDFLDNFFPSTSTNNSATTANTNETSNDNSTTTNNISEDLASFDARELEETIKKSLLEEEQRQADQHRQELLDIDRQNKEKEEKKKIEERYTQAAEAKKQALEDHKREYEENKRKEAETKKIKDQADIDAKRSHIERILSVTTKDIYSMLNLTKAEDKSTKAVQKAFKQMIFNVHPDKNPDPDASKCFAKLDAEYKKYLQNPSTYDTNLSYQNTGNSSYYRTQPSGSNNSGGSNSSFSDNNRHYASSQSKYESAYDFSSFASGWKSSQVPPGQNNKSSQHKYYGNHNNYNDSTTNYSDRQKFSGSRPEEQRGKSSTESRNEPGAPPPATNRRKFAPKNE